MRNITTILLITLLTINIIVAILNKNWHAVIGWGAALNIYLDKKELINRIK